MKKKKELEEGEIVDEEEEEYYEEREEAEEEEDTDQMVPCREKSLVPYTDTMKTRTTPSSIPTTQSNCFFYVYIISFIILYTYFTFTRLVLV
jgi:hypothetical protein